MTKYFHEYLKSKHAEIPYTLKNQSMQKRYAEIHLSSFLNEYLQANVCLYSATKKYNKVFAHQVSFLNNTSSTLTHLDHLVVKPSMCLTEMTGYKEHWRAAKREDVAYGTMRSVGIKKEIYGAWLHESWGSLVKYEPHPMYIFKALYESRDKK